MDKYSHRAPKKLTEVVGCLVAADFVRKYDLSYLGFEVDDWAWARYSIGTIPGLEKTPKLVHVILYAANQHRGMLLLAYPNKRGSFDAILNAYRLERHGMKWIAGYGNGGYADYRAISKYVTRLEQQPRYRVHLVPGGPNCGSFH
ncbi:MAG: hypothetical protein ACREBW_08675 [Candidatus Micrarchaeaceae archaeon]